MNRKMIVKIVLLSMIPVIVLPATCIGLGVFLFHRLSSPLLHELPLEANGQLQRVEWEAPCEQQELWLRVATDGGRDMEGTFTVRGPDEDREFGFTLSPFRVDGGGTLRIMWSSTPSGASGRARLVKLKAVEVGAPMSVDVVLHASPDTRVEELTLQVRGR